MHFPGRLRIELPSPVIEPEREVRGLLDLGDEKPSVCSVYGSGHNTDGIPFLRVQHIEHLLYRAVVAAVIEFLGGYLSVETCIYLRSFSSIEYIPYLALSERVVSLFCNLIVRMHLHRQLVLDVKEFDEQRKLPSVSSVYILPHYPV